jgi:hypothetical protein
LTTLQKNVLDIGQIDVLNLFCRCFAPPVHD